MPGNEEGLKEGLFLKLWICERGHGCGGSDAAGPNEDGKSAVATLCGISRKKKNAPGGRRSERNSDGN